MDKYFAVTDHYIIIPLKVIKREEVESGDDYDNFIQVTTEIACEVTSYMKCHHLNYFKYMWLDDNGLPDKGNVFADEKDAVKYAMKKAYIELTRKHTEVNALQKQILKLGG